MCLSMVQFHPTGHILVYTEKDWQNGLVMLDQELQFSQSLPLQTVTRDPQVGHVVMVSRTDINLLLQQLMLTRAVVFCMQATNRISSCPTRRPTSSSPPWTSSVTWPHLRHC